MVGYLRGERISELLSYAKDVQSRDINHTMQHYNHRYLVVEAADVYTIFSIVLLVGTSVVLFIVVCTYLILRILCGRDMCLYTPTSVRTMTIVIDAATTTNGIATVHDGTAVHLTGEQRRAALEAIFSTTTCKTVAEQLVDDEKAKRQCKVKPNLVADDTLVVDAQADAIRADKCKEEEEIDTTIPSTPSTNSCGEYNTTTPLNLQKTFSSAMTEFESVASSVTSSQHHHGEMDNVCCCSICLCGYKKDDVLVVSRHCPHCFHKDCILEWLLGTQNGCPICRVDMVTNSELIQVATSIMRKT